MQNVVLPQTPFTSINRLNGLDPLESFGRNGGFLPVVTGKSCEDCPVWATTAHAALFRALTRNAREPGMTGGFRALLATAGRN